MTQKNAYNVQLRSIEQIRPYDRNPRLNDDAVGAVAASLREFGFRQPIVVDTDGVIVCGHTRWKAAKKLGLAEVPGFSRLAAQAARMATAPRTGRGR